MKPGEGKYPHPEVSWLELLVITGTSKEQAEELWSKHYPKEAK